MPALLRTINMHNSRYIATNNETYVSYHRTE